MSGKEPVCDIRSAKVNKVNVKQLLKGWSRANKLIITELYNTEEKAKLLVEIKIIESVMNLLTENQAAALIYFHIEDMHLLDIMDLMGVERTQVYRYRQRGEYNFNKLINLTDNQFPMIKYLGTLYGDG